MDNSDEKKIVYSVPCTEKKEGETPIYRKPSQKDGILQISDKYSSLIQFWEQIMTVHADRKALQDMTFSQADDLMKRVGSWLVKNDHKNIFLYARNCVNWCLTDIACWNYGINNIPLYDTLGPQAFEHIIKITQGSVILTSESLYNRTLQQMKKNKYNVRQIIFFDQFSEEQKQNLQSLGLKVTSFKQLLQYKEVIQKPSNLTLQTHITYSFTSGTTGIPKGVVLTHGIVIAGVVGPSREKHWELLAGDVYISYLPVAHLFQRFMDWSCFYFGCQIQYTKLPVTQIVKQFARIKPTLLPLVPRLINKFYPVMKGIYEAEGNNLKIKGLFGGRIRSVVIGSAPVSPQVLKFFREMVECDLREGYGQTETCAASFITYKGDYEYGTVGGPNSCVEFKLVDVPQMNYYSTDNPPKGQVCMRGQPVFKEYFKNPQATKQTIDEEGWDHSGDIGEILPNGSLKIIDRKKNIYKLSQGEYVAPEKVENIYVRVKYIAESFVYGDSLRNFNVAIVHPNLDALPKVAKALQIEETDVEKLCENEKVIKFIHEEVEKQGKADGLFGFQQAKKIKLWPIPFMKVGILTSTMKLQRYLAKKVFKEEIEKLYASQ